MANGQIRWSVSSGPIYPSADVRWPVSDGHFARNYQEGGDCLSNYVVSSYTPTLGALLSARRAFTPVQKVEARILLAAVPHPYRGSRLPATAEEVKKLRSVLSSDLILPLPPQDDSFVDADSGATVGTMLDILPRATILHLASHGFQDPSNALESGFLMRDGILSISKLMPLLLPSAFLAFLSACETAQGDRGQPDQTVHLAATMLFAGFKSVVATMWSMYDVDGPAVATAVYKTLFAGDTEHLDPDDVPYALDAAVQELRAGGHEPSRWAPYIHIGI